MVVVQQAGLQPTGRMRCRKLRAASWVLCKHHHRTEVFTSTGHRTWNWYNGSLHIEYFGGERLVDCLVTLNDGPRAARLRCRLCWDLAGRTMARLGKTIPWLCQGHQVQRQIRLAKKPKTDGAVGGAPALDKAARVCWYASHGHCFWLRTCSLHLQRRKEPLYPLNGHHHHRRQALVARCP